MHVVITGATGLIGGALSVFLRGQGHRVRSVTRHPQGEDDIGWNPEQNELDLGPAAENGIDAVVHLAGENIASGRWTEKRKQRILESRERGTRLLCERLAALDDPPGVLVSASGVNYYPDQTGEAYDESGPAGESFLSRVCQAWEAATAPAVERGIRVVNLRLGVVLSSKGGALGKMLPVFRLGLGGPIGSGRQHMSWIAMDDVTGAIMHCIKEQRVEGPVNAVAPEPVTNREFTKTLAGVLKRPAFIPVPAWAVSLALGQMGRETLLADNNIMPKTLLDSGYCFSYESLSSALGDIPGSN